MRLRGESQLLEPESGNAGEGKVESKRTRQVRFFFTGGKMTISVNDEPFELEREMSVEEFVAEELEADDGLVVLVNDAVVPKEKRNALILKEGDCVEVVRFVSGG